MNLVREEEGIRFVRLVNEHGLEVGKYVLNLRAAKPIGLRTRVKELYLRAHPPQSPAIPEPSSDTQSIVNHLRRSDVVKLEVTIRPGKNRAAVLALSFVL